MHCTAAFVCHISPVHLSPQASSGQALPLDACVGADEHTLGLACEGLPLPQDALFAAIKLPNRDECLSAIHAALDAGVDVNTRECSQSFSALHMAVYRNPAAATVAAAG